MKTSPKTPGQSPIEDGGDAISVTAAIPAYNSERYLADAIQSVFDQTHPVDECLVIDDGSTDATAKIAQSFEGVRYVYQENGGEASARNRAIAEARGTHIAFLDSDDVWVPNKIELQLGCLSTRRDLGMVYTGVSVVDEVLRPMDELRAASGDIALRNTLLMEKPFMTGVGSSGLVPLDVARAIGFDERLGASADWAFACRVALLHPVEAVPSALVLYRQHGGDQVHHNLPAIEQAMRLVWSEIFHDRLLPKELRRGRRRAHANLYLSLAASYLKRGDRRKSARYLALAVFRRPDRVAAAIWRRYMGSTD